MPDSPNPFLTLTQNQPSSDSTQIAYDNANDHTSITQTPDQTPQKSTEEPPIEAKLPPPMGDEEKAKKYINWLTDLIAKDKLVVSHTDLKKFDLSSMQDHYRLDLNQYEVEVSHCKQPDSGQDSFIILFNNIRQIEANCSEKVILAYMPLTSNLFSQFKAIADAQIERKRKEAEEKKFKEAMKPIDELLEKMSVETTTHPMDTPLAIPPAQA